MFDLGGCGPVMFLLPRIGQGLRLSRRDDMLRDILYLLLATSLVVEDSITQ
jgi:hypothetical protein